MTVLVDGTAIPWPGGRRGAFPGSFNPPTVAHLAIAEAALYHGGLARVDLIVSRVPLGKDLIERPVMEDRMRVLARIAEGRPWIDIRISDARLLADLADGYDVLILGADKWAQLVDPIWYDSSEGRDAAVARIPRVLLAPRPPFSPDGGELLAVASRHGAVSSTGARTGRRDWMAPEAAAFDAETGAWSDPERYDRWRASLR